MVSKLDTSTSISLLPGASVLCQYCRHILEWEKTHFRWFAGFIFHVFFLSAMRMGKELGLLAW